MVRRGEAVVSGGDGLEDTGKRQRRPYIGAPGGENVVADFDVVIARCAGDVGREPLVDVLYSGLRAIFSVATPPHDVPCSGLPCPDPPPLPSPGAASSGERKKI
jgi:hypothetical protein